MVEKEKDERIGSKDETQVFKKNVRDANGSTATQGSSKRKAARLYPPRLHAEAISLHGTVFPVHNLIPID